MCIVWGYELNRICQRFLGVYRFARNYGFVHNNVNEYLINILFVVSEIGLTFAKSVFTVARISVAFSAWASVLCDGSILCGGPVAIALLSRTSIARAASIGGTVAFRSR